MVSPHLQVGLSTRLQEDYEITRLQEDYEITRLQEYEKEGVRDYEKDYERETREREWRKYLEG